MAMRMLPYVRRGFCHGCISTKWPYRMLLSAQLHRNDRIRRLATATSAQLPAREMTTSENTGKLFRTEYTRLIKGGLHTDESQRAAVDVLAQVGEEVSSFVQATESAGPFTRLLHATGLSQVPQIRGAYLAGGVGTGKTFLAELLYDCIPSAVRKRQHHFHAFILDVHARLHAKRDMNANDKIGQVARDIAKETRFLLLDEFQVTDISDAVIVHHLFRRLFQNGVILLATSNRIPERLYENGLQRELFLPVVPLIRQHCVVHVMDATRDYRLRNARADRRVYYVDGIDGTDAVYQVFDTLAHGFPVKETRINVLGRKLVVPMAVMDKSLAFFTFEQLCNRPLSSVDYFALCNNFHTICIGHIPILNVINDRNASRRFTRFIDTAYRVGTKIVVNAAVPLENLFVRPGENDVQTEEAFESYRLQSRLFEMQTDDYLERAWQPADDLDPTEKDFDDDDLVDQLDKQVE